MVNMLVGVSRALHVAAIVYKLGGVSRALQVSLRWLRLMTVLVWEQPAVTAMGTTKRCAHRVRSALPCAPALGAEGQCHHGGYNGATHISSGARQHKHDSGGR
jgi:hypothetical protein